MNTGLIAGSQDIDLVEEEAVELTPIALAVAVEVDVLKEIVQSAITLEEGLDTKSSISKASVTLRDELLASSIAIRDIYKSVLGVKNTLIASVSEVQAANGKAALIAQIEAAQAKLATL
jgi:hypothetical protein